MIGKWITFPIDEDELEDVLEEIGINDEYEEYFFTDYDCSFTSELSEYESIERLNEIGEMIEEDEELFEDLLECVSLEDAIEYFENENFIYYRDMTLLDVAYDIVEECYTLDDFAQRYFDYEAFARDLSYDGYIECANGTLYLE